MPNYEYIILGGGMAADAAIKGIREVDKNGPIGMISAEPDPPYKRPPLTKGLWKGKSVDSIWLKGYEMGVEAHLGVEIQSLDVQSKSLTDSFRNVYSFKKLLLATGGTPRRLPFDAEGNAIYYRTFRDYEKVRALADSGERFVVIGGGFIGSEIAAALAMNQKKVTLIFPEPHICSRIFDVELGNYVNSYYRERGVELLPGTNAVGMEKANGKTVVKLADGRELSADSVIAGIGITPNTQLAETAGIKTTNGIHVDDLLRTNHPDVFAAGDVADFYSTALGKHTRVEHEDNAVTMGRYAGMAMAGSGQPYHYLPYFYSDMFDLGYEAVGDLDSRLNIIADWKEPFKEGVVYYTQGSLVRGVLLWNVWEKVPAARELIEQRKSFVHGDLEGRIAA